MDAIVFLLCAIRRAAHLSFSLLIEITTRNNDFLCSAPLPPYFAHDRHVWHWTGARGAGVGIITWCAPILDESVSRLNKFKVAQTRTPSIVP